MTRIFRYILETDNGMAPCIDAGMVTLATCKPTIRRSARPGDWVLGFYPRPFERGMLAWAGRVTAAVSVGEYERHYRGRSDAVYRQKADGGFRRLRPDYHPEPDQMRKDLSAPVLTFDRLTTWYFGDKPEVCPADLTHLNAGGRGHLVNGVHAGDAEALLAWLQGICPPGIYGQPRHFNEAPQRTEGRAPTKPTGCSNHRIRC